VILAGSGNLGLDLAIPEVARCFEAGVLEGEGIVCEHHAEQPALPISYSLHAPVKRIPCIGGGMGVATVIERV
jgi:hypothetical protein